jgi:hypothetical protein
MPTRRHQKPHDIPDTLIEVVAISATLKGILLHISPIHLKRLGAGNYSYASLLSFLTK